MWEQDCGFVPVVDGANMLVGVVTDRDLCMASYMQGAPIASIPVVAVMVSEPVTCGPGATLKAAMGTLTEQQVHRLPVVDSKGALVGVLSMNDVMQVAQARLNVVTAASVLATMAAITKPRSGARNFTANEKVAKGKSANVRKAVSAGSAAASKKPVGKIAAKTAAKATAKPAAKATAKGAQKTTTKFRAKTQPKKAAAKGPVKAAAKPAKASKGRATRGKARA